MPDSGLSRLPDRYSFSNRLGRGSQKSVYLFRDSVLERQVAISAYPKAFAHSPLALTEARAMARIGDLPNLVTIYDVLESEDALYLVTRYLSGGSLADRLGASRARLTQTQLLRLAIHLSRALESLHSRNITHGDLTPSNVLLDDQGVAYVTDFGLSNLADPQNGQDATFCGTLPYMAPERAWGSPPTTAADIYGLGCILYEVATGGPPHAGLHPTEQLERKAETLPERASEKNPTIPEALSDLITATLTPDPRTRPTNAGDLRAALEGFSRASILVNTKAPAGASSRADELVGRRAERDEIRRAVVRSANDGKPQALLFTGDAGIGKSRLLRALAEEVQTAGGTATLGHTNPESASAFQPFFDAFLPLAPRIPELPEMEANALRAFLRLGEKHSEQGDSHKYSTSLDRRATFVGLLRALECLARERPLTVLIDDFEAADPDSVDLFEFLAASLRASAEDDARPSRFILAAAFREPPPGGALANAIERLQHGTGIEPHRLAPFDEEATYGLLRAIGLQRPASGLVRDIHEATHGNPLFILQAVDSLKRRDALEMRNGMTTAAWGQHVELPKTLGQAIDERTKMASLPCRRLLTIASFVGDHFTVEQLTAVAGAKEEALLDLIEEAIDHDLLIELAEGFRFGHPLIRQSLYRRSSEARRRRIHAQIAARLEQIHARDLDAGIADIAHHLVRAGTAADPEKTLQYAAAAAKQATRVYAWNDAAELYTAAIDAAEKAGRLSKAAEAELHRRAAEVHRNASDSGLSLQEYDEAIAAFEEANDDYGRAEALGGKLATQIARGGLTYGQAHETDEVEEALERLDPSETALRARLLGTLAVAHWATQEPEKASRRAREAISLAEQENDLRLAADTRCQLAMSELQRVELESALKTLESALVDTRRAADPVREEAALQRVPLVLQLLGRLDEARVAVQQAERLNRLVHNAANLSLTFANKTQLAALDADAENAQKYATECTQLGQRASYGWSGLLALPALASAHALVGHRDEAKQAINRILEPGFLFDDPSLFAESMTRYHRLIDAYAGDAITSSISTDLSPFEPGPSGPDFAFMTPLCVEVEIAWFTGAESISPAASRALALAHRRGMLFTTAWPFLIPRVRGMAAALEGRWDDAECHLKEAIEVADEQHIAPERARSRLDYSYLLLAREPSPRPDAAAEFLRESVALFRDAEMSGFVRRAKRLADTAGIAL